MNVPLCFNKCGAEDTENVRKQCHCYKYRLSMYKALLAFERLHLIGFKDFSYTYLVYTAWHKPQSLIGPSSDSFRAQVIKIC